MSKKSVLLKNFLNEIAVSYFNKQCTKKLSCGHTCFGLQNEICPEFCCICNQIEFLDFIIRLRCNHEFYLTYFDEYIFSLEEKERNEIPCSLCPQKNKNYMKRYNNYIPFIEIRQKNSNSEEILYEIYCHILRLEKNSKIFKGAHKKSLNDLSVKLWNYIRGIEIGQKYDNLFKINTISNIFKETKGAYSETLNELQRIKTIYLDDRNMNLNNIHWQQIDEYLYNFG